MVEMQPTPGVRRLSGAGRPERRLRLVPPLEPCGSPGGDVGSGEGATDEGHAGRSRGSGRGRAVGGPLGGGRRRRAQPPLRLTRRGRVVVVALAVLAICTALSVLG